VPLLGATSTKALDVMKADMRKERLFEQTPEEVVTETMHALGRGYPSVSTGWFGKFSWALIRYLPVPVMVDLQNSQMKDVYKDTEDLKNRFVVVTSDDRCAGCDRPALTRQFYVFPCQHIFHSDCLMNHVAPNLGKRQQQRLSQLQDRLSAHAYSTRSTGSAPRVRNNSTASELMWTGIGNTVLSGLGMGAGGRERRGSVTDIASTPEVDKLREEMDDLLASECVLCGEVMVRSTDRGFVGAMEEREEEESWRV